MAAARIVEVSIVGKCGAELRRFRMKLPTDPATRVADFAKSALERFATQTTLSTVLPSGGAALGDIRASGCSLHPDDELLEMLMPTDTCITLHLVGIGAPEVVNLRWPSNCATPAPHVMMPASGDVEALGKRPREPYVPGGDAPLSSSPTPAGATLHLAPPNLVQDMAAYAANNAAAAEQQLRRPVHQPPPVAKAHVAHILRNGAWWPPQGELPDFDTMKVIVCEAGRCTFCGQRGHACPHNRSITGCGMGPMLPGYTKDSKWAAAYASIVDPM